MHKLLALAILPIVIGSSALAAGAPGPLNVPALGAAPAPSPAQPPGAGRQLVHTSNGWRHLTPQQATWERRKDFIRRIEQKSAAVDQEKRVNEAAASNSSAINSAKDNLDAKR